MKSVSGREGMRKGHRNRYVQLPKYTQGGHHALELTLSNAHPRLDTLPTRL